MTTQHKIKYDGLDSHKGEYWYKCLVCGKSDWIAHYAAGQTDLNFYDKPCVPPVQKAELDLAELD